MTARQVIGNATLYLGDCLTILPLVGRVDAVITDPPYGDDVHANQRRVLGKGITQMRDIENQAIPFASLTPELREGLCAFSAQACDGWMLAFCQAEAVGEWRQSMVDAGAKWRRAAVWVKPDSSPQLSGDRPAAGHESIAMAWCGDGPSKWSGGGKRGVWIIPKHDRGCGHGGRVNEHPTQKPQRLMAELVSLFSAEHATVLDPCMGSGSTGVACVKAGRKFIGIEINPEYFSIACKRIEQAQKQQRMFA